MRIISNKIQLENKIYSCLIFLYSDCWWTLPVEELIAPQYLKPGVKYVKGTDTMDVWFDSGVSWNAVLVGNGLPVPCDLYLEGQNSNFILFFFF